jgi:uncharacterized protein (DUF111 family)
MAASIRATRWAGAAALAAAALLAAVGAASATSPITKTQVGFLTVAAGHTGTLTVPYPDALEYGNARYSGRVLVLVPRPGTKGRVPDLAKVRILDAMSVQGGSGYQARAHNGNRAGTAAVRVEVVATTIEPLPHS